MTPSNVPPKPDDHVPIDDLKEIVARSTSKVSVKQLADQGFQKVRVLKQKDLQGLILEAVDKVLARAKVEQGRIDREAIAREIEEELKRLAADRAATDEERQALIAARSYLEKEVGGLKDEVARRESQLHREKVEAIRRDEEARQRLAQIDSLTIEVERLRAKSGELAAAHAEIERLRGEVAELVRTNSELAGRMAQAPARIEDPKALEAQMAKLAERITESLSRSLGRPVPAATAQVALDSIFESGHVKVETNLGELRIQEKKGVGVGDALKKLKGLQRELPTPNSQLPTPQSQIPTPGD